MQNLQENTFAEVSFLTKWQEAALHRYQKENQSQDVSCEFFANLKKILFSRTSANGCFLILVTCWLESAYQLLL